jgi:23S rRNA pseudouridine1911/1915/1917 synthase
MTEPSPETLAFSVTEDEAANRLDRLLAARAPDISRARFQSLIAEGRVSVNGQPAAKANMKPRPGDEITVRLPEPQAAEPEPQDIPLTIIYEDEHLIVINKPAGMVVHPAPGHADGTLVNALLHHCAGSLSGIGGVKRPGIVHRLDRDTSGLMVAAKTDAAHAGLAAQFAAHGRDGKLERAYRALLWGRPPRHKGTISEPLARSSANRQKIAVVRAGAGREAITHYRAIRSFPAASERPVATLAECRLETGRTHQIRVHMAHIGCPVMGDETYGAGFKSSIRRLSQQAKEALQALNRQALHAATLGFEHPVTGRQLHFESPLPQDMQKLLEALEE